MDCDQIGRVRFVGSWVRPGRGRFVSLTDGRVGRHGGREGLGNEDEGEGEDEGERARTRARTRGCLLART